jgi:hypothetical protein
MTSYQPLSNDPVNMSPRSRPVMHVMLAIDSHLASCTRGCQRVRMPLLDAILRQDYGHTERLEPCLCGEPRELIRTLSALTGVRS